MLLWCNGEGVTKGRESCAEIRRPDEETVPRRMPEVVISGHPQDICRLFHGFWRNGKDDGEPEVEGLIHWQAPAGKAAAYKAASVQVAANVAAAVRTIAGNAAAAPEGAAVGSKRRVPSILALFTRQRKQQRWPKWDRSGHESCAPGRQGKPRRSQPRSV